MGQVKQDGGQRARRRMKTVRSAQEKPLVSSIRLQAASGSSPASPAAFLPTGRRSAAAVGLQPLGERASRSRSRPRGDHGFQLHCTDSSLPPVTFQETSPTGSGGGRAGRCSRRCSPSKGTAGPGASQPPARVRGDGEAAATLSQRQEKRQSFPLPVTSEVFVPFSIPSLWYRGKLA